MRGKWANLKYILDVVLQYEGDDCLFWPYGNDGHGRGIVQIDGKRLRASRVVCIMAHGEPPESKLHAAHSCGNGHLGCVTKRHLSWKTAKENSDDKYIHGTMPLGEKSHAAKLTKDQVISIRRQFASGVSQRTLGARFGVSPSYVHRITSRQKWKWLADQGQNQAEGSGE